MAGLLWGLMILLVVLWVAFKLGLGIAGVTLRPPLVAAVVVVVYNVIGAGAMAGASRRA